MHPVKQSKSRHQDTRRVFCTNYGTCLQEAIRGGWSGFSCHQCGDYHRWTTSLDVARKFGKEHKHVMEVIREEILPNTQEKDRSNFRPISLPDSYGRPQPAYKLTRAGFSILAMGFTGIRVTTSRES